MGAETPEQRRALDKAVLGLFGPDSYASTFLTTIYCSLNVSWDETFPTACTNGKFLKINPHWFMTLSPKMQITLLAHELWHIAFMHMARCGHRIWQIFNMAADHAINLMLIAHGYHFDTLPNGEMMGLADSRFTGMSTEQIYDILVDENAPINLPFGSDFSDNQIEELTPEEHADVVATIVKATIMAKMAGEAGKLPGELTSMMDTLLRPKLTWWNLFEKWLTEKYDEGYTWTRPNRRFQNVYLPSKDGTDGLTSLIYAIDCSGSLTDPQLLVINSRLRDFKEQFLPISMKVVSFDTKLRDTWEFTMDQDISGLEFTGRGGTNMHPVFEIVKKEKPVGLVMFSDMDCEIPDKVPGVDVLWVCLDRPTWKPPYGRVIHIDSAADL